MDVASVMRQAATAYRARAAVKEGERILTFGEAWQRGCRFANRLLDLGLAPGDRVAVIEDNCLESSDIFLGLTIANLVRVPLYARNSADGHEIMVANTGCRAIVASADYAADMQALRAGLPHVEFLIVRDDGYEEWLAHGAATDPMIPIDRDDYYIIRHTGGTTGKPRGVSYTHWSWLATSRDWFYHHPPVCPGDACLHVAPISHASGYFFIPIWLGGGCNVMLDRFDAAHTAAVMERERIAYMLAVPTILAALNAAPGIDERDFSALKCLVVTSAPIADSTALRARAIFGDVLYQGYGQTEAVAVAYMGPGDWFAEVPGSTPLRSCGRVAPYARLEIWDEDRRPVPVGTPGEIVAQIDGQMSGYWNDPERTAERLIDGWVVTGDIGVLDANGYLYLLDRADDMIVSGGYNIWPLELENAIYEHPAVLEVAVFGVPHPRWGETPMAAVVLKEGAAATAREIIQLCVDRLGSYKKPGEVAFLCEPLPKTPVGKIRRKDLREPYWAGQTRRVGGS